jgi:hypothetical protein
MLGTTPLYAESNLLSMLASIIFPLQYFSIHCHSLFYSNNGHGIQYFTEGMKDITSPSYVSFVSFVILVLLVLLVD